MKDRPRDKPQPVPPDKSPKPPMEIPPPPDQPGLPADDPDPRPKGDPPSNEPTRLVR